MAPDLDVSFIGKRFVSAGGFDSGTDRQHREGVSSHWTAVCGQMAEKGILGHPACGPYRKCLRPAPFMGSASIDQSTCRLRSEAQPSNATSQKIWQGWSGHGDLKTEIENNVSEDRQRTRPKAKFPYFKTGSEKEDVGIEFLFVSPDLKHGLPETNSLMASPS